MVQLPLTNTNKKYIPKIKSFYVFEYHEIDSLVKEIFPTTQYNFVATEESNNYCCYEFNGITKEDYPKWMVWDKTRWNEFMEKGFRLNITRAVLEYFVFHGILPTGDYLIEVFW